MTSHWANEQARQRIADLRREAAGTQLVRAARLEHAVASSAERRSRQIPLRAFRGTLGRFLASLAAITPWPRGFRRG
jgi:hypothetical protein